MEQLSAGYSQRKGPRRLSRVLVACLGVLGLLLVAGSQSVMGRADRQHAVTAHATALGEHMNIRSADGSEIALNTRTRVHTRFESHARVFEIQEGEALLKIAEQSERVGIIRVGGAEFETSSATVRARLDADGTRRIDVLSGQGWIRSVRLARSFASRGRFQPLFLSAGDSFRSRGAVLSVERFDRSSTDRLLAWTQGEVLFEGETLLEAVTELNRYNRRKLHIGDGSIAGLRIGGRFDATDIDAFVTSLHRLFGIRVSGSEIPADRAGSIVLVAGGDRMSRNNPPQNR